MRYASAWFLLYQHEPEDGTAVEGIVGGQNFSGYPFRASSGESGSRAVERRRARSDRAGTRRDGGDVTEGSSEYNAPIFMVHRSLWLVDEYCAHPINRREDESKHLQYIPKAQPGAARREVSRKEAASDRASGKVYATESSPQPSRSSTAFPASLYPLTPSLTITYASAISETVHVTSPVYLGEIVSNVFGMCSRGTSASLRSP